MTTARTLTPLALAGTALALALAAGGLPSTAGAQQTELKVGYMKHPIHEANVDMMEKWANENGVRLTRIPMAYDVFQEKVTATLTSGGDQFDVIWHNDDWGQLWDKWLEPTDDVPGMDKVDQHPLDAFYNDEGKVTVVPMTHTVGTFFYRTDLLAEDEVPTTFDELVEVSQRLQDEGQVKWGYVGGMKMNHTWFSFWWTMWSNQCDIFHPIFERDNDVLAEEGWEPAIAEPCHQEIVEFWWDAIHEHKISPPGMTSYGRDEANAIFMAGDAAFTLVDSTHYGDFNNPSKSRVAGNVGMGKFPVGPRGEEAVAWNEIWGWGIPKGVPEERKQLAKEMLGAMLTDIEGQVRQWQETGGPPPNQEAWDAIAGEDPVFAKLREVVFEAHIPTHSAYYFPAWPAVHKAYSDVVIKAVTGSRDDIPQVLQDGVRTVHEAAAAP